METTKNICVKDESSLDPNTVNRWFQKFGSICENLNDQARSSRPKSVFWGCVPSFQIVFHIMKILENFGHAQITFFILIWLVNTNVVLLQSNL